jgi:F-type H+-transporting ATPase subunit epsilon
MILKLLLPTEVLIDEPVDKIIVEGANGSFCLLPRHIDFVAALVPGILSFNTPGGTEHFVALDEGTLVKCGPQVMVSSLNAVRGTDLHQLRQLVEDAFLELDDFERRARTALARLEAGAIRGFRDLQETYHE